MEAEGGVHFFSLLINIPLAPQQVAGIRGQLVEAEGAVAAARAEAEESDRRRRAAESKLVGVLVLRCGRVVFPVVGGEQPGWCDARMFLSKDGRERPAVAGGGEQAGGCVGFCGGAKEKERAFLRQLNFCLLGNHPHPPTHTPTLPPSIQTPGQADANTRLQAKEKERAFLKQLSDSLLSNQKDYAARLAEAQAALARETASRDAEIQDLRDQVGLLLLTTNVLPHTHTPACSPPVALLCCTAPSAVETCFYLRAGPLFCPLLPALEHPAETPCCAVRWACCLPRTLTRPACRLG